MADNGVNATPTASSLIQAQVSSILVEPLQAASVVLSSGAKVIDSSTPVRIPTIDSVFNPAWVGENEKIPEDATRFGELELMPTNRKSIKLITRVSNELIRMAQRGVSELLQTKLVEDVKVKLDTALLTGDGADNSVTGLVNSDRTTAGTWSPKDPDTILDALAAMAAAEVTPDRLFMAGSDFYAIRKLKDADGRALLQPDLTADAVYRLHGIPVTVTNKLEAGKAILARMQDVVVVRDIDPQITVLTERYAEYDQTAIRVKTRYDLGILRPESVRVLAAK